MGTQEDNNKEYTDGVHDGQKAGILGFIAHEVNIFENPIRSKGFDYGIQHQPRHSDSGISTSSESSSGYTGGGSSTSSGGLVGLIGLIVLGGAIYLGSLGTKSLFRNSDSQNNIPQKNQSVSNYSADARDTNAQRERILKSLYLQQEIEAQQFIRKMEDKVRREQQEFEARLQNELKENLERINKEAEYHSIEEGENLKRRFRNHMGKQIQQKLDPQKKGDITREKMLEIIKEIQQQGIPETDKID